MYSTSGLGAFHLDFLSKGPSSTNLREKMPGRHVTAEELRRHNTRDSVWLVVDGNVYDLTEFAPMHPGGSASMPIHSFIPLPSGCGTLL